MLKDKVLLTYKRKRFSFQNDFSHDAKAINLSPNIEKGSSWISSLKFECDANDEKLENHHPGKCKCSTCNGGHGFIESIQKHVLETKRSRQSQTTEQKDMGPMVLRSRKVLTGIKLANVLQQATSLTVPVSHIDTKDNIGVDNLGEKLKDTICAEESLTAPGAVHDRSYYPINLNMNLTNEEGECSSGCPKVRSKMSPHSHSGYNAQCNDGVLKDNLGAQLITFSRRAKVKQDPVERITDRNLKVVEKQSLSDIHGNHGIDANFNSEGLSQKCVVEKQVSGTSMLSENCAGPSSQVDDEDKLANDKVDVASDCIAEVGIVSNIEELSKEFVAIQPANSAKDYIFPRNTESSNSGNNTIILSIENSGNKLITDTGKCEEKTMDHSIDCMIDCRSVERDSPSVLELSVMPTSVCEINLEENKLPDDVGRKILRDLRSSSTPCCSIFADEENDAKSKEIEWLESLDNALREKEKGRGISSLILDDGFSSKMPNQSAEQSVNNQNIGIGFTNHFSALSENFLSGKISHPIFEEQLKIGKPASFTDFLGRQFPLNPDNMSFDLNTSALPSCSYFRENAYIHDKKLLFSSKGNPSFSKHCKHITENSISETILTRKCASFFDNQMTYSSEWSEEELDFLWIGVRRHGMDNWNAILMDPKLQFAHLRLPEDLSLQWEQEQKKLFTDILFPPLKLSKPSTYPSPVPEGLHDSISHSYTEHPHFTETKLSLGDVYHHKESTSKSSPFSVIHPLTGESSSAGNFLSMSVYPVGISTRHNHPSMASMPMCQIDHSFHKQFRERSEHESKPAGLPAGTNLPHWLKEACSSHLSPSDIQWPPFLATGNTLNLAINDTVLSSSTAASKDLRTRGILKRRSVVSGKNVGIIKTEEASTSIDECSIGLKPSVSQIQTPASERPPSAIGAASHQKNVGSADLSTNIIPIVVPNDLVVLDSDASSEETISDDQNRRA